MLADACVYPRTGPVTSSAARCIDNTDDDVYFQEASFEVQFRSFPHWHWTTAGISDGRGVRQIHDARP